MAEDTIFPLIDRPAPVAEAIRERRNGAEKDTDSISGVITAAVSDRLDDSDKSDVTAEVIKSISEALEVPEEAIDTEKAEAIVRPMVEADPDNILEDALLEEMDDEGQDEEEDGDGAGF